MKTSRFRWVKTEKKKKHKQQQKTNQYKWIPWFATILFGIFHFKSNAERMRADILPSINWQTSSIIERSRVSFPHEKCSLNQTLKISSNTPVFWMNKIVANNHLRKEKKNTATTQNTHKNIVLKKIKINENNKEKKNLF